MSGYSAVALALSTLAFTLCFAVWGLVAPLAPEFGEDYDLSASEVGLLVAVPVLLGSLLRIPVGALTDRHGGRIVFTSLMIFLLLPLTFIGFAGSYQALLFWGLWLGVAGASFAVGIPFTAQWFPPRRQGLALGIYGMGNIGTALSSLAGPRLADSYGEPWAFWAFLPALVLMAAAFWALGREKAKPKGATQSVVDRIAVLRRYPLAWVFSFLYFLTFGGFVAISVYLPTYLVEVYDLEQADAGTRAAGFVVIATLARPIGGYLADRWAPSLIVSAVLIAIAVLALILALGPGFIAISAAFLATAFALGLGNGAIFKQVPEFFPRETGTVTGLVGAAGGLGGFFPPLVMGFFRDTIGSYAPGFALLSLFAVAGALVNWTMVHREAPPGVHV